MRTSTHLVIALVTSSLLAVSLAIPNFGCAGGAAEDEIVKVVLPAGDPAAGRQAFVDLQCTSCHDLSGAAALPKPTTPTIAPDLTQTLAGQGRGPIASSIMNPQHANSVAVELWSGWSPSQRVWLGPMPAPPPTPSATPQPLRMTDYRHVMTVEELCDLVAFLEANAR